MPTKPNPVVGANAAVVVPVKPPIVAVVLFRPKGVVTKPLR